MFSNRHIVLIGRPGAGKSTIGKLLEKDLELPFISSGDVARALAKEDPITALALSEGQFAPEGAMRQMIRTRLERADATCGGYVLDGFPRFVSQLVALHSWSHIRPLYIEIAVPEYECIERLIVRGRDDDTPDSIADRLASYKYQTQPLLDILVTYPAFLHFAHGEPYDYILSKIVNANA